MVLDFLVDWDIGTLILAALVLTVVVLAGSYGMAVGWRRWKDARRRRRIAERRAAGGEPPTTPSAAPAGRRPGKAAGGAQAALSRLRRRA